MWHKPNQLNLLANFLYVFAIGMALYSLALVIVRLSIFSIHEVKVNGEVGHVNREQVQVIVAEHLNGNFFTLDLIQMKDAFEKLPWVRKVSVRRRWPNTLSVEVEEHQALARWGGIGLVNKQGELFHAVSDVNLPVFYGPTDDVKTVAENYLYFEKTLNNIDMKIVQMTLSKRHSWEVKTDKRLTISLGRGAVLERLQKFSTAYQTVLIHLKTSIQYADLRYPNGFAVRKGEKISIRVPLISTNNGIELGIKRELA
ncbi:MAG: FtsQ-type POTRA domain-containing protein [Methylophilaceae bacterium]|jgi:cell division protein FtsQ|nr:FtsQ-type POTRA domain-containing protein [Methylophilaceae bacterium]